MNGILFTPNTKFEVDKMMNLIFPSFKEIIPALIYEEEIEEDEEEIEEEGDIIFGQEQFDNIIKNVYNTYEKIPFDTDEEWEFIMNENIKLPETDIINNNDDEIYSDDEFYVN